MQKLIHHIRKNGLMTKIFNPIVITDIDGVLLRGNTQISGTLNALHRLKQENIPLACLTNGGGQLEKNKVKKMNEIFGQDIFHHELMFMNHSPIRPHLNKFSKLDGILLLSGSLKITDIVDEMGITNYVTADELYALFHQQSDYKTHNNLSFYQRNYSIFDITKKLIDRLNIKSLPSNYHQWGQIINSIFALNDVSPYETTLQVIHNVFAQKQKRNLPLPPYFAAQNDIVWAGGYHRPRLAFGPFNYMLEKHCNNHNFELNKFYFGKPQKLAFQFVEQYMKKRYGQGCFFMIGDNPRADIRGANSIGWASFLTQTGVHLGSENDNTNPATVVVKNFQEAIDMIVSLKKQNMI